jgi:hypothetical protein
VAVKLLAAALILPATIVLAIAAFETRIFYPAPSNAPTKGIVWDGHTFAARGEFARWLRSRGIRYGLWARRHPLVVGYAANNRAHPQVQQAEALRARQKGSDLSVERLGGGAAVLAGLGLAVVLLVRRRRPGSSGGSAKQSLQLAESRAVSAPKVGARLMLRWAKATTLLSLSMAKSSARIIRRRGPEFAKSLAHRAVPAAKGGARLMLRWANATALLSSSLATSSAHRIRRRGSEFAWYLATALLAAGIGVVTTVWLNGV